MMEKATKSWIGAAFVSGMLAVSAQAEDLFDLHISVGRVGVMVGQGETALRILTDSSEEAVNPYTDEYDSPKALHYSIYHSALAFNALQADACALNLVGEELCEKPYRPRWMNKVPGKDEPSPGRLASWNDDLQARVSALTGALCDKAISKSGEEFLCAIE